MSVPAAATSMRLGDLLLKEGLVTRDQLDKALLEGTQNGTRLGYALVKLGFVQETDITKMLARQFRMPAVDLSRFEVDPRIAKLIPADLATKHLVLPLKRQAFKRAITNLVTNATRYGAYVVIRASTDKEWLRIDVDDDGPGIPPAERENVFRPFYRLGNGRNQDTGNTGLGLAIARDIARSHGGDIALGESSMGGLRATVRVPL